MCGICGIAYSDPSVIADKQTLVSMRDSMTHRGPDDAGDFIAPGIALGSRRLAILDLSERGHMPMASADGRYKIVYNGEIYNFRDLRSLLEKRGYQFKSNSDTEVLLTMFVEEGPLMLDRLNGMFAFAIWDSRERSLFIARDRLGVKPLYYALASDGLYFASEEKSLFAAGIDVNFNPDCLEELLCFRYVAGEHTPFVNINRLLAGHYLQWQSGDLRINRWWNLAGKIRDARDRGATDISEWFRETFDDSVSLRRISDVPVGVLLSGGLDSSSVAASLARQTDSRVSTFTVRFAEEGYDEGPLAKLLAEKYNLDYHELTLSRDDLMARLQDASWFNDEPLAHGNDPYLLAISGYAKPKVTVLLSGEGADETLGGYVRYRPLQHPLLLRTAHTLQPGIAPIFKANYRLRKLGRFLSLGSVDRFTLFNSCDLLPSELDLLDAPAKGQFSFREKILFEAQAVYPGEPMRQAMFSDLHTFLCSLLDRNDRMTMGASIECRVPFLDFRLVEGLAALPASDLISGNENKRLLRQSIGARLPVAIRKGRKWGFGVPWHRYFREIPEFRELVMKLPMLEPIREGYFVLSRLRSIITEFLAGDDRHAPLIRQLVMITIWRQTYFKRLKSLRTHRVEAT